MKSVFLHKHLIMSAFLLQPIAFGSWLPRIPDMQKLLALGPADLSLALLGMPLGIILVLPVASSLLARKGSRFSVALGFVLMLSAMILATWSVSQSMLFVTLAIVGSTNTVLLLALNVEGSTIENLQGTLILNTCHGFGSIGLMIGSLLGSVLAIFSIPLNWAMVIVAAAVLPVALIVVSALPDQEPTNVSSESTKVRRYGIPDWPLLGICLFAFGIAMTEGAMADWSAVYLRDVFGASAGAAGLGFTLFAAMVAVGRFTGDRMKGNWGAMNTARLCTALAMAGVITALMATTINVVYVGFIMLGFGVSVGYPLAVSAVGIINNRPANANVATLTFIALLGFLVGPPIIGFIAEYFNFRVGLAILIPVLFASLLLTGSFNLKAAKGL